MSHAKWNVMFDRGAWLGLSMFPGYADVPNHSPVRVDGFDWLDDRCFRLRFLDLAYTAGVARFDKTFGILKDTPELVVCDEDDQPERVYLFNLLTSRWMANHFANLDRDNLFDPEGRPNENALLALI